MVIVADQSGRISLTVRGATLHLTLQEATTLSQLLYTALEGLPCTPTHTRMTERLRNEYQTQGT